MQFPESWLRQFCNPPLSTAELADLLTMSGLEVEDLSPVAPPCSGVVVAEVLAVTPHPNAQRLNVCQVSVGGAEPLTIVCGAPNVRAGLKVPCAQVGAVLPPGADGEVLRIGAGQLRGVESWGMLCSARELGLSDDHGGLLVLSADAPVGQDIRTALNLDDTVFTLKLTPNWGHGLSVLGVAREVSALTGAPLTPPPIEPVPVTVAAQRAVHIHAPDLCGRFVGRVVTGINPQAPTPAWMVDRLARCGQRSVSALVDISNYVMFECGRPSHMFDAERIQGDLQVRWAREGESLTLLNGQTITLQPDVGVIADDHAVESLAGIMGGEATAVSDTTREVFLEMAFWWPQAVAGRARRYHFTTDAGHRFERGVDFEGIPQALERLTALVLAICGGQAGPVLSQTLQTPARTPVRVRVARAARVIGMPITDAEAQSVMQRLGLPCEVVGQDQGQAVLAVTPPSWRFDLTIEEDLIEEIIRVMGFSRLPGRTPRGDIAPRIRPESSAHPHALRRELAALGWFETINFSFVEAQWEADLAGQPDPIRLINPIASPLSVMRSTLMGSLLNVLRHNLTRRVPRVRVFEIGRVFYKDASVTDSDHTVAGVAQPLRVGGLAYGPAAALQWGERERWVDFYDIKGDLERVLGARCTLHFSPSEHPALHPGRCATVWIDGVAAGVLGELHPQWRQSWGFPQAPILFELDLEAVLRRAVPQGQRLPRQQTVLRDLALVVGEGVTHADLQAAWVQAQQPLVRDCTLFDIYRPAPGSASDLSPGERSVALRLSLRDDDEPLTEARIDAAVAAVLAQWVSTLGARLR